VIGSDHENVTVLLACLVDLTDGLVGSSNALNGSLVHTGVANHVGRGEVVHNEVEFVLANALSHLGTNTGSAHLGVKIVGGHFGGGDHVADLAGELLLNAAVEEESDVGILFSLSDVALGTILLAQPLGKDITHVLGRERNGEGEVGLVLGHGGDGNVLRVGEVRSRGAVVVTQQLGDLTNTVRTVVEEEDGVIVWDGSAFD